MDLIKLIIFLIIIGNIMDKATDYTIDREEQLKFEEKLKLLERQR